MAGFEDMPQDGSSIEKAPTLYDTSNIVNGQYIPPVGDRLRTHKAIANNKPVMCNHTTRTHLPAIIRVNFHDKGPKNLCQYHWDKIKHDTSSYEPGPMWLPKNDELANAVKGEDAVERQQGRARDAAKIFETTGEYIPVRGPGNPTERKSGNDIEDHVTPVIERAATGGGHVGENHEQKLYTAHQALLASIDAGGGDPDPSTYHKFAEQGGLKDATERNKYFIHAMNHHKKLMGRTVTPKADPVEVAAQDFNMNYMEEEDLNNPFDTISDLMSNDYAPVSREAKARGTTSYDD